MYVACNMALLSITRLHLQTLWEIEMASESSTLNTLAVNPSPRSLASQHLQANIYLTPLVGTATHSSSTSQQLSGVAPSWPSCRKERNNHCQERGCIFSVCFSVCVCVRSYVSAKSSVKQIHLSLTSTFLISPTSEPWDSKLSREPASKPFLPSCRSNHNLSVWV